MTQSAATTTDRPRVTGTCPERVVTAIRHAVHSGGTWQETTERVVAALRAHLPRLTAHGSGLLTAAQLAGDPSGYQTHLVHAEPDGSFSVVVMVWLPGQRTEVHDHVTWCCTAVLEGTEYEEVFAHRGDHLEVVARNVNPAGTVSGFAPPGDIHQVANAGDRTAVSMHVYGTDISRVGTSVRRVYDLPVR
jgi:3-mercaptopropionate dioxygenase